MKAIKIKITRFVDDHQPGFVECKFNDAFGKEHIVIEKVPIVINEYLNENSSYPQDGVIACIILKTWQDDKQRKIVTVTISEPIYNTSEERLTEFDLLEDQLTEYLLL